MKHVCVALAFAALAPQFPAVTRTKIDIATIGPQVGQKVPDFSLLDQTGQTQTLASILGPKGALLVFFRSADW